MRELTTDRLRLRRFAADDADFLFDMHSRWEVQRYLGTTPRVMADRSEAVERAEQYASLDDPVLGTWAITDKTTGERFGTAFLKPLPLSGPALPLLPSGEIEIGWYLHPDSWGRGYASEAAERVLSHAFDGGLERVLAVTYPENAASQAVARRIGMTGLGITSEYYNIEMELFRIARPHPEPSGENPAGGVGSGRRLSSSE